MSMSSLAELLDEKDRTEFPFPKMNSPPHSSSTSSHIHSDTTPPYLARSLPDSFKSSRSSSSQKHHHHQSHQKDRDHDNHEESSAKLLSRLVARRDVKHMRTLLVLTNDRLEAETRRADQAEQRVVDVLYRLRTAHENTALAQSDAMRAQQEVKLYQMQLEQARQEIMKAQELVDRLEALRKEAEEDAARARSIARKCREQWILGKAMEEGRKDGFREGFERGRWSGHSDGDDIQSTASRSTKRIIIQERRRDSPPLEYEDAPPASSHITCTHRVTPVHPNIHLPRYTQPERLNNNRVPDSAPISATLPVPTLVTPLNAPSPSHERPDPPKAPSPHPLPVPVPTHRSSRSPDPIPIPIHNAPPSPRHPPIIVPPDGYIPYAAANDERNIILPPPHELSRPVSPVDPSPSHPGVSLPPIVPDTVGVPPPGQFTIAPARPYEGSIRSRDYAYRGASVVKQPMEHTVMNSPQSRSTTMSQFDILGSPKRDRFYRRAADKASLLSRQTIPEDDFVEHYHREPPRRTIYAAQGPPEVNTSQQEPPKISGPYDKIRKRMNSRRSSDKEPDKEVVPDIQVESPSTDEGSQSSRAASMIQPSLLSPDHANHALPALNEFFGHTEVQPAVDLHPPSQVPDIVRDSQEDSGSVHSPTWPMRPGSPYVEAPVPSNVKYPDPPGRSTSRASSARAPTAPSSSAEMWEGNSMNSRRRRGSVADRDSLSGRLSPLSFGMPFASFTATGE